MREGSPEPCRVIVRVATPGGDAWLTGFANKWEPHQVDVSLDNGQRCMVQPEHVRTKP